MPLHIVLTGASVLHGLSSRCLLHARRVAHLSRADTARKVRAVTLPVDPFPSTLRATPRVLTWFTRLR